MSNEFKQLNEFRRLIDYLKKDEKFDNINKVYLFGSRAYKTNSTRSDIDLLVLLERPIPSVEITYCLSKKYPPVDFFKTADMKIAESVINGSAIHSDDKTLDSKLDAIELWDKENGFSTQFTDWTQKTRAGVDFKPTTMPLGKDHFAFIQEVRKILQEQRFPDTILGTNWVEIGETMSAILDSSLNLSSNWTRGKNYRKIELGNEYDFQNLIEQTFKPWLPSLEKDTIAAIYDNQKKLIDFSINWNTVLIEAKHIKDANTEAKALKEIEGVKKFYESNTNVKLLFFWVLVEKGYSIDKKKIETDFSKKVGDIIIITKLFQQT